MYKKVLLEISPKTKEDETEPFVYKFIILKTKIFRGIVVFYFIGSLLRSGRSLVGKVSENCLETNNRTNKVYFVLTISEKLYTEMSIH